MARTSSIPKVTCTLTKVILSIFGSIGPKRTATTIVDQLYFNNFDIENQVQNMCSALTKIFSDNKFVIYR